MKKVLIVGYGKSGKSANDFLQSKGFATVVYDDEFCNPEVYLKNLNMFDFVVVSPSIKPNHRIVAKAKGVGVPVVSEIEMAYLLNENRNKTLIGVTGTNGKTTIVSMIKALLGESAIACGNFGLPWSSCVEFGNKYDVIELSSFQLENVEQFRPNIAVISNLKPDHLDWHGCMSNYIKAKLNILKNLSVDNVAIVNAEDNLLMKEIERYNCQKFYIGFDLCLTNCCTVINNQVLFVSNNKKEVVLDCSNISIVGRHNWLNLLSAVAVAKMCEVENEHILTQIQNFKFDRFRMEVVCNSKGLNIINDSKSTNLASTIAAIETFLNKKIVLILGGIDKQELFDDLFLKYSNFIKRYIFYGKASKMLIETAQRCNIDNYVYKESFEEVVKCAIEEVKQDDVLLFSPACASFDLFKDYQHRGKIFEELVLKYLKQ